MRKGIVWGHHLDEYQDMFGLTKPELHLKLLEYGCGASAVNAELLAKGNPIVSCDPLFILDKPTLVMQVSTLFENRAALICRDQDRFDFSHAGSLDRFITKRRQGVSQFFNDYEAGKSAQRYVPVTDWRLPFPDFSFDIALSSHYLFVDLEDQNDGFYGQVIRELARVAKEVRIFPLIDRQGHPSPLLGPVLLSLQREHYGIEICEVTYALQPMGNAMLRVRAERCLL